MLIASYSLTRGSFTGATARKHGHIEHANGGTLFLVEIGDMSIDLRGLLLRFLQEVKSCGLGTPADQG